MFLHQRLRCKLDYHSKKAYHQGDHDLQPRYLIPRSIFELIQIPHFGQSNFGNYIMFKFEI